MTEQIPDSFEYDGRNYSIVDVNGDGLFNPFQYGMEPISWCTVCWSGYLCTYKIQHKMLYLNTFEVCLTEPSFDKTEEVKKVYAPNIEGYIPIDTSNSKDTYFEYLYKNINLPIDFTGNFLIGDDSIDDSWDWEFDHPMYRYRNVLELTFQSGVLMLREDISHKVADRRIKMTNGDFSTGFGT
jgi:flavorubredoxin